MSQQPSPIQEGVKTLSLFIPGEATTVYLAGVGILAKRGDTPLLVLAAVCFLIAILAKVLISKAEGGHYRTRIITSAAAFLIWAYAIQNPFQALGIATDPELAGFIALVFTIVAPLLTALLAQWIDKTRGGTPAQPALPTAQE